MYFQTSNFDKVVVSGNTHGGILALLELAYTTNVFTVTSKDILHDLMVYHRSNNKSNCINHHYNILLGNDMGLHHLHWNKNLKSLCVLNGNMFSHITIHEREMNDLIKTILRLSLESKINKGRLVWLIGNDELFHMLFQSPLTHGQQYNLRNLFLETDAMIVCGIDQYIVSHGGITVNFVEQCKCEMNIQNIEHPVSIEWINIQFTNAIYDIHTQKNNSPSIVWVRKVLSTNESPSNDTIINKNFVSPEIQTQTDSHRLFTKSICMTDHDYGQNVLPFRFFYKFKYPFVASNYDDVSPSIFCLGTRLQHYVMNIHDLIETEYTLLELSPVGVRMIGKSIVLYTQINNVLIDNEKHLLNTLHTTIQSQNRLCIEKICSFFKIPFLTTMCTHNLIDAIILCYINSLLIHGDENFIIMNILNIIL
jgi:hypothetical protein